MIELFNILKDIGQDFIAFFLYLLKEIDPLIIVFLFVMILDIVTGITLGGKNKSRKTKRGGLSSKICEIGMKKKAYMIVIIMVTAALNYGLVFMGYNDYTALKDFTVLSFIIVECLSIIENAADNEVPIPTKLKNVLEILKEDGEKEDEIKKR